MKNVINRNWYLNLNTDDEREEFKLRLVHSQDVLDQLCTILHAKVEATTQEMGKATNYATPAWSEMMADRLGYMRALNEIKLYTNIKSKEK